MKSAWVQSGYIHLKLDGDPGLFRKLIQSAQSNTSVDEVISLTLPVHKIEVRYENEVMAIDEFMKGRWEIPIGVRITLDAEVEPHPTKNQARRQFVPIGSNSH